MTVDSNFMLKYYTSNIRRMFIFSEMSLEPVSKYIRSISPIEAWQTRQFYRLFSSHPLFLIDGGWALFPLSPDPFQYFIKKFEWLPIILSEDVSSESEYLAAIHQAPESSPADALATVGEAIVCCSRYGSALYYFNQITDVALEFTSEVARPFEH